MAEPNEVWLWTYDAYEPRRGADARGARPVTMVSVKHPLATLIQMNQDYGGEGNSYWLIHIERLSLWMMDYDTRRHVLWSLRENNGILRTAPASYQI